MGIIRYFYILANGRNEPLARLLQSQVCGEYIRIAVLYATFVQYESGQQLKEALTDLVDRLLVQ
ncbi:MAG: hypothetical protein KAH18_10250 [Psychromonas sp.]|nr:hypothetical protein [Psychromonas sp.]